MPSTILKPRNAAIAALCMQLNSCWTARASYGARVLIVGKHVLYGKNTASSSLDQRNSNDTGKAKTWRQSDRRKVSR